MRVILELGVNALAHTALGNNTPLHKVGFTVDEVGFTLDEVSFALDLFYLFYLFYFIFLAVVDPIPSYA